MSGRWLTIGGSKDDSGKRRGGSPVFIEGGRITKGAPSLHGKKIDALKEEGDSGSGSHRAQMAAGRSYNRAVAAKAAREHGIKSEHLHQLAGEILAHDKAFVEDRKTLLQDARKLSERLGYGNINNLRPRIAGGRVDSDSIKGLDDVAERMVSRYPEHFHGHEDAQERLFDLLSAGNPEPMSEDDAYEQATEQLREGQQAAAEPEDDSQVNTWQNDMFGGQHSIARQRGMFGDDKDDVNPFPQKKVKERTDLPGQQMLPGTEHNVPFKDQFGRAEHQLCGCTGACHCSPTDAECQEICRRVTAHWMRAPDTVDRYHREDSSDDTHFQR